MVAATSFFLIWTTAPHTFQPRFMRSVESIFRHHPAANVTLFSNSLPDGFFAPLVAAGLRVQIRRYDLQGLVAGTRAEVWYDFRRFWNQSAYFANHEADLLRLLLLEREGGIYVDTDVIFVHPLSGDSVVSAVGIESGGGGAPGRSRERATGQLESDGGGGGAAWSEGAVLCNAVMAFDAGAPFVRRALRAFISDYVPFSPGLSFEVRLTHYGC